MSHLIKAFKYNYESLIQAAAMNGGANVDHELKREKCAKALNYFKMSFCNLSLLSYA